MKRVIYKKTGEVNKETKQFKAILFRSRERKKMILIGNSPIDVTDGEYEKLKSSKHGKDIMLYGKNTKLPKPIEVDISSKVKKTVKKKVLKLKKKKK